MKLKVTEFVISTDADANNYDSEVVHLKVGLIHKLTQFETPLENQN